MIFGAANAPYVNGLEQRCTAQIAILAIQCARSPNSTAVRTITTRMGRATVTIVDHRVSASKNPPL